MVGTWSALPGFGQRGKPEINAFWGTCFKKQRSWHGLSEVWLSRTWKHTRCDKKPGPSEPTNSPSSSQPTGPASDSRQDWEACAFLLPMWKHQNTCTSQRWNGMRFVWLNSDPQLKLTATLSNAGGFQRSKLFFLLLTALVMAHKGDLPFPNKITVLLCSLPVHLTTCVKTASHTSSSITKGLTYITPASHTHVQPIQCNARTAEGRWHYILENSKFLGLNLL